MVIIKRYPNRKLYNTRTSSYVTLGDLLFGIYNHGYKFKVIDMKSNVDITALTITRAIFEHHVKHNDFQSVKQLEDTISYMHGLRSIT